MKRPLRVMQIALRLDPGGAERLIVDLARKLPPGYESLVCCLDSPGEWGAMLAAEGMPVFALQRESGFRPSVAWRIASLVRRHRVGVLHAHQYTPYVYGSLATMLAPGVRLVFTEHGRLSDAGPSSKRRLVNPWLARIPGARFAVCRELREFLIAEGFPARSLGVIYNGIDLGGRPEPAGRAPARARLSLPPDRFVIGTVARLDPVKDHAALLEACATIRAAVPSAHLVLVGDGPERAALERRAGELGVLEAVTFAGSRADARLLLPGFDLYVNSSRYEGVSLTIIEAMAAGLPVVATRVGGTPEVIDDGRTGVLVPPGDPSALAAAAVDLARDPSRRRLLAAAARDEAERRFALERMLEEYAAVYRGEHRGS
ncbi:MAG: glycosyltransferase [Candidatus Eiseniibacteriota bacterium]